MKRVSLPGTNLTSSVLGFGSAALMARVRERESLRILGAAFDAGVTHFDTARMYGYGEAERVVGKFIADKRDKVTVTTKFGILPPRRSPGLSLAKAVARRLVALHPRLRRAARQQASKMVTVGCFDVQTSMRSLETSLSELKTEYVDVLLLHECRVSDVQSDSLLEFLEKSSRDGKVRHYGIATDIDSTRTILQTHRDYAPVVQFGNNIVNQNVSRLPSIEGIGVLTHSAFGEEFKTLRDYLRANPDRSAEWSGKLSLDCSDVRVISGLMLQYAVSANPAGVVIYSSLNEQHIRENVRSISREEFSPQQVSCFVNLVARHAGELAGVNQPFA